MKVTVQLYGISLPSGSRHELELPECSTVEQAIYALADTLKENVEELFTYILQVNGARANRDSILSDGDKVLLLKTLGGG